MMFQGLHENNEAIPERNEYIGGYLIEFNDIYVIGRSFL